MGKDAALLVIDVQLGMFESRIIPSVYAGAELLSKIKDLIAQARSAQVPIIYIQHRGGKGHPLEYGSIEWRIHPDIEPMDKDLIVEKSTPDAFHETNLHDELIARQIKSLLVAGIQTEFCVDTTCRRAFSLGYDVALVQDAHSTWDTEILTAQQIIAHHNAVLEGWFVKLRKKENIQF